MAPTTTANEGSASVAAARAELLALRTALEAARSGALTAHAAAGLARPHCQKACRALRAAEGLCRSAAALLRAASPTPPALPLTPSAQSSPAPRRRGRGKRGGKGDKERAASKPAAGRPEGQEMEVDDATAAAPPAATPSLRALAGSSQAPAAGEEPPGRALPGSSQPVASAAAADAPTPTALPLTLDQVRVVARKMAEDMARARESGNRQEADKIQAELRRFVAANERGGEGTGRKKGKGEKKTAMP